MKLSEHFDLEEFTRSQTAARLCIDNTPPLGVVANLSRLAITLEAIRNACSGRPITISSGYRCPTLNQRIGGSRTSAHMDGRAADIHVRGMSPVSVAQAIVNADIELDQLIYEGAWVHVGIAKPGSSPRGDVLTAEFSGRGVTYRRGIG